MNVISYEIMDDGMIRIETDDLSGKNHQSADELLESLGLLLGGEVTKRSKRTQVHTHNHVGGHQHQ